MEFVLAAGRGGDLKSGPFLTPRLGPDYVSIYGIHSWPLSPHSTAYMGGVIS